MIPLLVFLLALAAIYIGTIETAFSVLMKLSLRVAAERGGRNDRLGFYLDNPIQLFVPARLLLGVIFSLATALLAIATASSEPHSLGLLLMFVVVLIVICEHLVPLLIIRKDPERVLEVILPPFDVLARAMFPLTGGLVNLISDPRRERGDAGGGAPEEQQAAESAPDDEQGLIEGEGRKLLQSIVDFGDTLVREVMTPRPDMVAIEGDATLAELRKLFQEQEYSRVPVYRENLDNILGVVYVKDLIHLENVAEGGRLQADVPGLVRPATFVPETKRVADLLKEFQRRQTQMAIVVDEYGGTAGLATIEDLLEEIVGEIRDEYDVETEPVVEEPDGSFVFSGKVNFDEVRERLDVEVEPEGFETVGGYVLTRVGRVPGAGERFELDGMEVEVLEAERRRIHRVRFKPLQEAPVERR